MGSPIQPTQLILPPSRRVHPRRQGGFSLVEICAALGLVGFCLLSLLGLCTVGMQQERQAQDQARAAQLLGTVVDEFRGLAREAVGGTTVLANRYNLQLPAPGSAAYEPSSAIGVNELGETGTGQTDYVVYYRVIPPPSGAGIYTPYKLRIFIAWPGSASFSSGTGVTLSKARGSIETTLELNRGS